MTIRYIADHAGQYLRDGMEPNRDGDWVEYVDYEKLVEALRWVVRYSTDSKVKQVAEAALLSAGEEL